jgi:hypothetical protein
MQKIDYQWSKNRLKTVYVWIWEGNLEVKILQNEANHRLGRK